MSSMQLTRHGAGVFTIDNFLSVEECRDFVTQSEAMGFLEAGIRTDDGEYLYKDARNNDRVIFDDAALSLRLYTRAVPMLPAELDQWTPSGFNPRWRFYRYENQQQFTWHQDGTFRASKTEESLLTFMIYLNDDFEGGHTAFGWETIQPKAGMALVFPHRLRHQGSKVSSGVKYVLRTDVMYREGVGQGETMSNPGIAS